MKSSASSRENNTTPSSDIFWRSETVHAALQHFSTNLAREQGEQWTISAFECGGGGDCLFHSIQRGLESLREKTPITYLALATQYGNNILSAAGLRQITASQITSQPDVEFLNQMLAFRLNATQGYWQDGWSPEELLIDNGFGYLTEGVTRINGVQFEGDNGLVGFQSHNGTEDLVRSDRLSVYLAQLRLDFERTQSHG